MKQIQDYLLKTKSAVQKIYEAYDSYYDLMRIPQRPAFLGWGDPNSDENKIAYEKWQIENKKVLNERHKRDNEFTFETFARSILCGSILQFGYNGKKYFQIKHLSLMILKILSNLTLYQQSFVLGD